MTLEQAARGKNVDLDSLIRELEEMGRKNNPPS